MKPKTILQFQIKSEIERDEKGLRVKAGVRGDKSTITNVYNKMQLRQECQFSCASFEIEMSAALPMTFIKSSYKLIFNPGEF